MLQHKCGYAASNFSRRVLTGPRKHVFSVQFNGCIVAPKDCLNVLFDVIGLTFFDQKDGLLSFDKTKDFLIDYGVGDIHNVHGNFCIAERVAEAEKFKCPVNVVE